MTSDILKQKMVYNAGVEALEAFRDVFTLEFRDNYRLTLIARDEKHPDGSRDLVITSDIWDELIKVIEIQKNVVLLRYVDIEKC